MNPRRLLYLVAAILAAVFAHPATLRAQADVIRGRVTAPDNTPIENAQVTATSIGGGVSRTARTDKSGRFTITFPGGDGDYMMTVAALGFSAKRFELKRTADQDILVADTKLQVSAQVLDAMQVQADRATISRSEAAQTDIGGSERGINMAGLPPDLLGDLAAMAASLPGVQLLPGEDGGPNGYSVLGLGADQNNSTLNGLNFGGANLPRDAMVNTSLATAPYDVSRGGFSGGQLNLRSGSGNNYVRRTGSMVLSTPQLQWTDRAAQALGTEYTNVSLGGGFSGPLQYDKSFYNGSIQLGRLSSDNQTLLNTDPEGLQAAGVSADSAERLLRLLNAASVPTDLGLRSSKLTDNGSLFGALDFAPPSSSSGHAFNLTFNGSWSKQSPLGSSPFGGGGFAIGGGGGGNGVTALPTVGADRTNWNGGVQGRHSGYLHNFLLTETSFGIGASRTYNDPYLDLPSGRVLVNSSFNDGSNGLQNLSFGGGQQTTSQSTYTAQAMNQLSWFSSNNKHRLKLTTELRNETVRQDQSSNLLGTFSFASLEDLEHDIPSSFTRQLSPRAHTANQLVGALALGDSYRRSGNLQFQYGVRLDGNHFFTDPNLNTEIEDIFGVRNDRSPNRLYVSPRLGFSWTYGTAAQIAAFQGAMRGPRAVVRGGVGVFQNVPGTNLIGGALDNTGLPGSLQQLVCVGPAAPVPDWDAYAADPSSIPDRCADGTTGTVFANSKPNVVLFSDKFVASRSVRGNLQWNGPILSNRFNATFEATYSRNLNQQSPFDLNFNPTVRFTLPDEGGRPVFVNPTSIVPATGTIASRDSRVSDKFSRVTEMRSDLTSDSKQFRISLGPGAFRTATSLSWNASYVLSNVREQFRGFTSTVGNPTAAEWGRASFDSRHQINLSLGYNFFDFVRVNWSGNLMSGRPFTPGIIGDVNGDGTGGNDRAFIFDPSKTADPALAGAMRTLLRDGSAEAQSCLRKQLGRLAGRNSCQGPWTSSFGSMRISFNPLKVRMPQRATLSFTVSNPLGAADLMLHGQDNLRGWGQNTNPDPTLFYVRGFDPQTKRYTYQVNQRFGATNPAQSALFGRNPVTIQAQLSFDLGPARERQELTQQLDRGRTTEGTKAEERLLKAMYASGRVPNPMAMILRSQDTLKLTGPQADSLATLNRWFTIRSDSIWTPVTRYLANLPNDYDRHEAYERYRGARQATVDLLIKIAPAVKGVLTADQRRMLPAQLMNFLDRRYLAAVRSSTTGSVPGMGGMGGMPMMGGGPTVIRQ